MENIKLIDVEDSITKTMETFVVIDKGDDGYITMPKATWDELQAKQTEGGLI